jgi:hypothetical protein
VNLSKFKGGTYSSNPDGTVSYRDFGAGVFYTIRLGYFSQGQNSIPAYAPLIFSIKLYEINRLDSDGDGILNFQEDLNNDGYIYNYSNKVNYPTFPADNIRYEDDSTKTEYQML